LLKSIFLKSGIIVFSIVLSLFILEISIRIFTSQPYYGYPKYMYRNDQEIGFSLTPDFEGRHIQPDFNIKYNFNSYGFRGREIYKEELDSSIRLLLLGDSVAFGNGVSFEKSWAYRLEKKLNNGFDEKQKYIVVNTGVPGYGQDEEIKLFKKWGKNLKPHIVLTTFCTNDWNDNSSQYIEDGYVVNNRGSASRIKVFLNLHSRLYTFIVLRIKSTSWWHRNREDRGEARISPPVNIAKKNIASLDREVKALGMKHYLVYFPDKTYNHTNKDDHRRFLKLCKELNIPVIDLYPEFNVNPEERRRLYFKIDPHWNDRGNEHAAEAIYKNLKPVLKNIASQID
jgi:hypothetical protein